MKTKHNNITLDNKEKSQETPLLKENKTVVKISKSQQILAKMSKNLGLSFVIHIK